MKPLTEILQYEGRYFFLHSRLFTAFRYLFQKKKIYKKAVKTAENFQAAPSEALYRDMARKYCSHLTGMQEYFLFDCAHRSYREIEEFIGSREKRYWVWKLNDPGSYHIFKNKYETYCRFKAYYGRELIRITAEEDFPLFCRFLMSNGRIIVKPLSDSCGNGVYYIDAESEMKARAVFNYMFLRFPDGFIAEEVVMQCPEMAAFHPQSVNTVRMMTIRHNDYVRIWHPFFRMGQGNSWVDNANSGGIECMISPETGVLEDACDFKGQSYSRHPDTGHELQGFRLPRWEEALQLARKLAEVVPEVRYVGWDLALTEKGWIVIEGNHTAGMGYQHIGKRGIKEELRKEIQEIRRGR